MIEINPSQEEHFPGITAMKEQLQVKFEFFVHHTKSFVNLHKRMAGLRGRQNLVTLNKIFC